MKLIGLIERRISLMKIELRKNPVNGLEDFIKSFEKNIDLQSLSEETLFEICVALGDINNASSREFHEVKSEIWEIINSPKVPPKSKATLKKVAQLF